MSNKYREAGVDLEAGYESVRLIKSHVARTKILGAVDSIGAFGGMFDLSKLNIKEPVLVSGTDGVGTKLMLAFACDIHDTIGIDAVAMCVNDVLVQGAYPIFFLDYLAVGKNVPTKIEQLVKGVADGCVLSECALIGGETAEMPDMYSHEHYDIAGFCVGVADKSKLLDGTGVKVGDTLIGLPSSGCHSNGYSLVRKVLIKDANLDVTYLEYFLDNYGFKDENNDGIDDDGKTICESYIIYIEGIELRYNQNGDWTFDNTIISEIIKTKSNSTNTVPQTTTSGTVYRGDLLTEDVSNTITLFNAQTGSDQTYNIDNYTK